MPKLTKRIVEAAEPRGRDYFIWCDELPSFGVRVFASGKRSYLVQYRAEGRTRRVSIGLHGAVTCEEARKRAKELLGRVAAGENPAEDREAERKAMTVRQLCDAYLAAAEKGLILGKRGMPKKATTLETDIGRINRHIIPLLGNRKVRDLTTPDIARFMRDVIAGKTATDEKTGFRGRAIVTGGKGVAARTVGLLGGVLSFAVSEGIIGANPVRGVKRPADERREVRLSPEQYRALDEALITAERNGVAWQAVTAARLLALTGCRRNEIAELRWADVDLAGRCLRLSDSKTGKSVRPLGAAAAAILADLPRSGPLVLPGRDPERPFSGLPKAWLRIISSAPDLEGVTMHGLRHGFASFAADLGMTEITIAGLLGHSSATVTGRYIHHVDTALCAAADRVAARIAAAMNGGEEGAEVIAFRPGA
jgi:integrase